MVKRALTEAWDGGRGEGRERDERVLFDVFYFFFFSMLFKCLFLYFI